MKQTNYSVIVNLFYSESAKNYSYRRAYTSKLQNAMKP